MRVLAEAFRVLRPGGRLAIVDLVLEHDLPAEIQTHPAAWAGCLSGALSEIALYKGLRRAGFREVSIEPLESFGIAECALYPLFDDDLLALLRALVPPERHDRIAMSVLARGRKPASGERLAGGAGVSPARHRGSGKIVQTPIPKFDSVPPVLSGGRGSSPINDSATVATLVDGLVVPGHRPVRTSVTTNMSSVRGTRPRHRIALEPAEASCIMTLITMRAGAILGLALDTVDVTVEIRSLTTTASSDRRHAQQPLERVFVDLTAERHRSGDVADGAFGVNIAPSDAL